MHKRNVKDAFGFHPYKCDPENNLQIKKALYKHYGVLNISLITPGFHHFQYLHQKWHYLVGKRESVRTVLSLVFQSSEFNSDAPAPELLLQLSVCMQVTQPLCLI